MLSPEIMQTLEKEIDSLKKILSTISFKSTAGLISYLDYLSEREDILETLINKNVDVVDYISGLRAVLSGEREFDEFKSAILKAHEAAIESKEINIITFYTTLSNILDDYTQTTNYKEPIEKKKNEQLQKSYKDAWENLNETTRLLVGKLSANSPLIRKLDELMSRVERLHKHNEEPIDDLIKILTSTNSVLTQEIDIKEYNDIAQTMQGKPSKAFKVLGGLMAAIGVLAIGLGLVLSASGVAAAPGLGLIAAGGVSVGAGYAFFAKSGRSGVNKRMKDVADNLEANPDDRLPNSSKPS